METELMSEVRKRNEPRPDKVELIENLAGHLRDASAVVLTQYAGVPADELDAVRRELTGQSVTLQVVKNTLLARSLEKSELHESLQHLLKGPIAVATTQDEATLVPKALAKAVGDIDAFTLIGGLLDGSFYDAAQLDTISKLPSKPELLAQVGSALVSPISSVYGILGMLLANIGNGIQQLGKRDNTSSEQTGGTEMSEVAEKVEEAFESITNLSVLEAAQLYQIMQDRLGITAVAPVAQAAAATAAEGGDAAEEEAASEFDVVLQSVGDQRVPVIKALRELISGLELRQASELVKSAPAPVREAVSKEEAAKMKETLEAAGATVDVNEHKGE